MSAAFGPLRVFLLRAMLILLVLGVAGEGMISHAGLAGGEAGDKMDHTAVSVAMNHEGTADADKAICAAKCLALAIMLPVAPAGLIPVSPARMTKATGVILPLPFVARPAGPPPKPQSV